ncbi:MAG: MotA/TolQ/ExbB proton channel family protein [Acidobacteria bacterium]|nr:MotA/TolQ/ExbB proton channel family protein [Acidobacteriota bacterium]MCI0664876.1 MotA/TolQ/ExbB proton channel family protein [Acidobacteriota bacterium]
MDPFVRLILSESYAYFNWITNLAIQSGSDMQVQMSLTEMLRKMSYTGIGVIVVLLIMSIYSVAIMLERYLTFNSAAKQSREFVPRVAEMLRSARLDDALKLTQSYRRSHLAVVINSGLQELGAQGGDKGGRRMRKARRALRRATAMKIAEMQRGLSGLATIGSTAPFVGLFGTVIGIMDAFHEMNRQETTGLGAVAGGISEALIATAFGLLVAIPAVWMFNYFTSRVSRFAVEMNNSADELIDFFLQQADTK